MVSKSSAKLRRVKIFVDCDSCVLCSKSLSSSSVHDQNLKSVKFKRSFYNRLHPNSHLLQKFLVFLHPFKVEFPRTPLFISPGWHSHAPTAKPPCTSSPGARPVQKTQARPQRAARRFSSATKPSRRSSASPRMTQRGSSAYPLQHSSKCAASSALHAGRTCVHASRHLRSECGKLPGLRSTRKRRQRRQRRQSPRKIGGDVPRMTRTAAPRPSARERAVTRMTTAK